ncbi:MAG: hypothetical protein U0269_26185 [Polyangiales bacterium]
MNQRSSLRHPFTIAALASLAIGSLAYCTGNNDASTSSGLSSGGSSSDAGAVSWPEPAQDAASAAAPDAAAALPEGAECATDSDCVPAGCCHATACVPAARRPACEGIMCTMDCRPGTLDCGGGCLCQAGRCAAQLSQGPVAIDAAVIAAPDASAPDASAPRRRRR